MQIANYGKTDCAGDLEWTLWAYMPNEELYSVRKVAVKSGHMSAVSCPKGTLSKAGTLKIELNNKITAPVRCDHYC